MITAGIDVGSTYTKAAIFDGEQILATALAPTGFRLSWVARKVFDEALADAGLDETQIEYVISSGIGRHQVGFKDLAVTDLTASARGANYFFPGTRTVLDVGGQTMKASRIAGSAKVEAFRLNDKCAAGTGAFLEKTARYMGYSTEEIGPLMATARETVPISGVCAVFAESEVINHLSLGTPPCDIMQGAIESLTGRSVQLMKRVKAQPEYTLVGGILRFHTMADAVRERLGADVNVPPGELCQFAVAVGCAILAQIRLRKVRSEQAASPAA
ncbi:MAG TPA: acyl-CoA dehydratase activase [Myxococcota bacterium]|nr:acyl-CoA dehydratase activase [Myxococcota bacterium]